MQAGRIFNATRQFSISPFVMVTHAQNKVDSYTETGADTLNLEIAATKTDFLEGRVGSIFGYNTLLGQGSQLNSFFKLSYGYDFAEQKQSSQSNFVGQTTSFSTTSANVYQGSLRSSVGFDFIQTNAITLSAEYAYELRGNYQAHFGMARLRYDF